MDLCIEKLITQRSDLKQLQKVYDDHPLEFVCSSVMRIQASGCVSFLDIIRFLPLFRMMVMPEVQRLETIETFVGKFIGQ